MTLKNSLTNIIENIVIWQNDIAYSHKKDHRKHIVI
jgi:hypothetical protein